MNNDPAQNTVTNIYDPSNTPTNGNVPAENTSPAPAPVAPIPAAPIVPEAPPPAMNIPGSQEGFTIGNVENPPLQEKAPETNIEKQKNIDNFLHDPKLEKPVTPPTPAPEITPPPATPNIKDLRTGHEKIEDTVVTRDKLTTIADLEEEEFIKEVEKHHGSK